MAFMRRDLRTGLAANTPDSARKRRKRKRHKLTAGRAAAMEAMFAVKLREERSRTTDLVLVGDVKDGVSADL